MKPTRRSLVLGLPALAVFAIGADGSAAEVADLPAKHPSPFANVERAHPAYAAIRFLEERGFFVGYPDGAFNGGSTRTRYEFAVGVQRLAADYERVTQEHGKARPLSGPVDTARRARAALLESTVQSAEGRRGSLVWIRVLVSEFRRELGMLGTDSVQLLAKLDAWEAEATAESIRNAEARTK